MLFITKNTAHPNDICIITRLLFMTTNSLSYNNLLSKNAIFNYQRVFLYAA